MKRRSFLQLAGLSAAVAPAVAAGDVDLSVSKTAAPKNSVFKFNPHGALRPSVDCDLSEVSLEEAIITLVRDRAPSRSPTRWLLVTAPENMFTATRLCAELADLQQYAPLPMVFATAVDYGLDTDAWGVVAEDGRRFYSPGVLT